MKIFHFMIKKKQATTHGLDAAPSFYPEFGASFARIGRKWLGRKVHKILRYLRKEMTRRKITPAHSSMARIWGARERDKDGRHLGRYGPSPKF